MLQTRRLLFIEKKGELSDILIDQLNLIGEFNSYHSRDMLEAEALILSENIELIILFCGDDVDETQKMISHWRAQNINIPIIIITNFGNDIEAITLLEAGANDYLNRPFRLTILVARIRAHLRQYDRSTDAILAIGPYWFRQDSSLLVDKEERKIHLTDKESSILRYLYRSFPKVVERSVLLDEVWGYASGVTTHTLETHIYRLRQKMELDPKNASILVTENRGYRLNLNE